MEKSILQHREEYTLKCYDDIMSLLGGDDFKELIQWIRDFGANRAWKSDNCLALPSYFWILKRGGGINTFVSAFTEYLHATNMIDFTGSEKFINHKLEYMKDDHAFTELTRLDNTIKKKSGYHRYFRGVLCIDINDWIGLTNEIQFNIFLRYIESKRDKILTILYIHRESEDIIKQIETSISSQIRFDTVRFRFPEPTELVGLIQNKFLQPSEFSMTDGARDMLMTLVCEAMKSQNFNGFITIEQIANDLLFYLLRSKIPQNEVTESIIVSYKEVSDYVKRLPSLNAEKKSIGFGATS
jgi:hypothetical protein